MKILAVLAAVLLWATACAGTKEVSGDLRTVGSVSVTFKVTPAEAELGRTIRVSFRLINSGREETLTFPDSQRFDFWATLRGRELWRWSDDEVFTAEVNSVKITSQGALLFSKPWKPTEAGNYTMHGELLAEGYEGEMTGKLRVR